MDWKEKLNSVVDTLVSWATTAGVRLIIAIVLLFVTFKIVNLIGRKIEKQGNNGKLDKTLAKTFAYVFKIALKVVIAIDIDDVVLTLRRIDTILREVGIQRCIRGEYIIGYSTPNYQCLATIGQNTLNLTESIQSTIILA